MSLHGLRCSCGRARLGRELTEMERDRFLASHYGVEHDVEVFETLEALGLVWHSAREPFAIGVGFGEWAKRFEQDAIKKSPQ